jgi:hypothetical protein
MNTNQIKQTINVGQSKHCSWAFATVAAIIGTIMMATGGCAILQNTTTSQKAAIAKTATREATVAWVVADKKSSQYVTNLQDVVSYMKTLIAATDKDTGLYDALYPSIADELGKKLSGDALTYSKLLATFALNQLDNIKGTYKTQTVEDTKTIALAALDGVSLGLDTKLSAELYQQEEVRAARVRAARSSPAKK